MRECEHYQPKVIAPEMFPVSRGIVDGWLNAPRKAKKKWNRDGSFVSIRSRKGRRQARDIAREQRKLKRISESYQRHVVATLNVGRKPWKMFKLEAGV